MGAEPGRLGWAARLGALALVLASLGGDCSGTKNIDTLDKSKLKCQDFARGGDWTLEPSRSKILVGQTIRIELKFNGMPYASAAYPDGEKPPLWRPAEVGTLGFGGSGGVTSPSPGVFVVGGYTPGLIGLWVAPGTSTSNCPVRAEIEVVAPDEELAVPYISLVIPDPPNDEVTLKGAFPGASDFAYVMIDDTYVSPFASGLDEIQFHSPPGVTSGMVKVITKGGVSNAVSYAYTPILGADMGSSDLVASADLLPGSGDLASPSSFALVPDNGDDAATIVINGPNLENIKQVLFTVYGFAVESPVTPVSATSIQVVVPDTAITGPITLTFYGAGDQQTPIFHRLPKIEIPMNCVGAVCFFPGSFSISGYGLSTVTAIKYGDAVATAFTVQSDTLINQIQFDVNTPSIYESPTGTPNHFAVTVTSPYRTLTDAFGGAMGCTSDANCAGNATLNKCSIQDDVCATTN